ncbi:GNAT family N-acetyltransferase [Pseudoalteromonas sp. T1lg65]|uniref:GNAT family N-acetyltransferase n=1 Tax=Pseudoalteromonas sp. T1lg65 TaxID=2077101 RepID=UPI003F7A934D
MRPVDLTLRPPSEGDRTLLVEYLNNDNVTRYLSSKIPKPYTLEDADWWLEVGCKQNAIVKAIEAKGIFCGVIGVYLQGFEYKHSAELGYWIAEPYWRRGIATEAVKQFVQNIFANTDVIRIFNPVTAQNQASIRVLEKNGFSLEGILKSAVSHGGVLCDEHLYAKVKGK